MRLLAWAGSNESLACGIASWRGGAFVVLPRRVAVRGASPSHRGPCIILTPTYPSAPPSFFCTTPLFAYCQLPRRLVNAGLWVLWLLGLQYLLLATVTLLHRHHLPRSAKPVKLHWARMLAEDIAGYSAWVWPIALLAAWRNPGAAAGGSGWTWDYSCPNLLVLGYYAQATLMAYDMYRCMFAAC